ncbi:DgyrCDS12786 [Dimorphilus gyrociliatus]|uniref:DgyrCDS12786 n=1 Tax=Dimorphilus gyrociliatus TaxID=2664684 RepID=A0A7I8W8Q3_9ANNE|nr:DgyrCDS12786 [Dimorphilus gyrociliatus]
MDLERTIPITELNSPETFDGYQNLSFDTKKILEELITESNDNFKSVVLKEKNLFVGEMLGKGQFGIVYLGRYVKNRKSLVIAIKTMQGNSKEQDVRAFLKEILRMKKFNHPNVLSTFGIVLRSNMPLAIMPYMKFGDLKCYISDKSVVITLKDLLQFALNIAEGMAYLAANKFVHRDLATRNCMVDKHKIVKVADFGLSRDVYGEEYYVLENRSLPLPIRWLAPESLIQSKFSTKSDIYTFGVLLWELFSRGKTPYYSMGNVQAAALIREGQTLEKPKYCPDDVFLLMKRCWNQQSNERPSFYEIAAKLKIRINRGEIPNVQSNLTFDNMSDNMSDNNKELKSAEYVSEIIGKHSSYLIPKQLAKEKQSESNIHQHNGSNEDENNQGKSRESKISEILNACEERDASVRKKPIIQSGKKTAPKRILGTIVSKTVEQIDNEHAFRIPVED